MRLSAFFPLLSLVNDIVLNENVNCMCPIAFDLYTSQFWEYTWFKMKEEKDILHGLVVGLGLFLTLFFLL